MSSEMEEMRTFADQIWKYFKPKVEGMLARQVGYFRAEVVSNPGDGTLVLSRPYESNITLPCTAAMSDAHAGEQVVAFTMGSLSNAVVVADGRMNLVDYLYFLADSYGPSAVVSFANGVGGMPVKSCAVSALSSATVWRTGKNMADQSQLTSNSTITWNGNVATWTVNNATNANARVTVFLKAGVTYTLSCYMKVISRATGYDPGVAFRNMAWTFVATQKIGSSVTEGFVSVSYTPSTDANMMVGVRGTGSTAGSCELEISQFQLEIGSEKSDYVPYQGGAWTYDPDAQSLTPSIMTSAEGANRIWSDGGDVSVEYGDFLRTMQTEIEDLS